MAYSVRISGTVLSSLLYECANSKTDIEGLFLGTLSYRTTLASDDSNDQAFEKREDFILVHGYQVLNEKPYDSQGNMRKEYIKNQQSELTSIMGYFNFRRQTDVLLSVRDRLWMKSWTKSIPHGFIAIISSCLNSMEEKSTQTYEFAFWDMEKEIKLSMDITNMTESTAAYKHFMSNTIRKLPQHSSNHSLVQLPSSQGIIDQYDQVYQESIKSLRLATQNVVNKEAELYRLQKEIQELKNSNK